MKLEISETYVHAAWWGYCVYGRDGVSFVTAPFVYSLTRAQEPKTMPIGRAEEVEA